MRVRATGVKGGTDNTAMVRQLLVFAEAAREQCGEGVEHVLRLGPAGGHIDGRAACGRKRQKAHDRAPAHRLAAARDGYLRIETLNGLHEFGGGAGVEPLAVDHREPARMRPDLLESGRCGPGFSLGLFAPLRSCACHALP